jgi:hypothetical protein
VHTQSRAATAWLGLTPEPERLLPELLAYLQDDPGRSSVGSERRRVTNLVLRGNSRRWLRYLDRAAALALGVADGATDGDAELALAVAHVVLEHDRMLIGLPGSAYDRTAERRQRLAAAIGVLEAQIASSADIDNHLEKS